MCSSVVRRNFLLKYEHRIKDKELHDKEQNIYTDFIFIRFKRTFTNNFSINFCQKGILKKIMQKGRRNKY